METKETVLERCAEYERELRYPPLNPTITKEDIIQLLHDVQTYAYEDDDDCNNIDKEKIREVDSALDDIDSAIRDIKSSLGIF